MAFDQPTRNRLARFVSDARTLIAGEFTDKFQSLYGISNKGELTPLEKLTHLDQTQLATAAVLRERIDYLVRSYPEEKGDVAAAVERQPASRHSRSSTGSPRSGWRKSAG